MTIYCRAICPGPGAWWALKWYVLLLVFIFLLLSPPALQETLKEGITISFCRWGIWGTSDWGVCSRPPNLKVAELTFELRSVNFTPHVFPTLSSCLQSVRYRWYPISKMKKLETQRCHLADITGPQAWTFHYKSHVIVPNHLLSVSAGDFCHSTELPYPPGQWDVIGLSVGTTWLRAISGILTKISGA